MSKTLFPDGGPAFPIADTRTAMRLGQLAIDGIEDSAEAEKIYMAVEARAARGMSQLQYAAFEAMKTLLSYPEFQGDPKQLAKSSYDIAQAMIEEGALREKTL